MGDDHPQGTAIRIECARDVAETMKHPEVLPLVALTMGDVAGIGPEVIARAWLDPAFHDLARPLVIGDPGVLHRAARLVAGPDAFEIQEVGQPEEADPSRRRIPCVAVRGGFGDLADVRPGSVDRRAGRAAYEFLNAAIDLALEGRIDAIATLPLNKQALHQAGVHHPGHTEILAERCKVPEHAMMLYLEGTADDASSDVGAGLAARTAWASCT